MERTTRTMSARLGLVVVSIDFRWAPEALRPAQLDDAETALQYFMRNARRWRVDPSRISVCGESSGGHMALTLAMRWRHRFFEPERCPNGKRSSTCAVLQSDPEWLPNIKLQFLIYPPLQFVNFTLPSYVLYDTSVLATRFMTYKSLGWWLFGEPYGTDTRFLNALVVNNHTTRVTREKLSKLYFDEIVDVLNASDIENGRRALANLSLSEFDPNGDPEFESRYLQTLLSEDVSPFFAKDFSHMAPIYLVSAGLDGFRDELWLFAHRLRRSQQVAFVENAHYANKYHGFLWMDPQRIIDDFAVFLRSHPNAL